MFDPKGQGFNPRLESQPEVIYPLASSLLELILTKGLKLRVKVKSAVASSAESKKYLKFERFTDRELPFCALNKKKKVE